MSIQQNLAAGTSLEALNAAMAKLTELSEVPGAVTKATYNQSNSQLTGLTAFDLETPAKMFYPVLTPLRNMIPRVSGRGGIQANWRAITGININAVSAGVSEGHRGAVITNQTTEYNASYRGLGLESSATFEAQYAGQTYDDVRRIAAQTGLQALMLDEESVILGGNGSLQLGTTPTPSLVASTTGGALATATYSVICVALSFAGYRRATVSGGLIQQATRTNADSSTDTINYGTAQKSANATVAVTGATGSATASVNAVRGAMGYAWFWGAAGSEVLGAITTVPKYTITATAVGTQTAASLTAADYSVNSLVFDGVLTQALKAGSGAYWADLGGAPLTSSGSGTIVEIDALLANRWDNYRLGPSVIWCNSIDAKAISNKILAGIQNTGIRYNITVTNQGQLNGGTFVTTYQNQYGMNGATDLQIRTHPNMPQGTILFTTDMLPYALNDVNNLMQIRTRQEYYQIEWPLRTRSYEYGVYVDEVLQIYAPFSLAVLTGVGLG